MKAARWLLVLSLGLMHSDVGAQSEAQLRSRKVRHYIETTRETKNEKTTVRIEDVTLDGRGHTLERKVTDDQGAVLEWKKFERTKKGDLLSSSELKADGSVEEKRTITYNALRKPIKEVMTDGAGKMKEWIEIRYNNFGDKEEEVTRNEKDEIKRRIEYSYDAKGLLTERKVYNAKGEVTSERTIRIDY